MVNSKNLAIQWITILLSLGILSYSSINKAGGMAVIDMANVKQSTITAIEAINQTEKQIEQYRTQLQQYENMIRNTLAPPAYVWAKVEYTMTKLINLSNSIRYYEQQYGGLDSYMQRFRNVEYYRSSSCFTLEEKCSDSAWKLLQDGQNTSTDSQKQANDSLLRGLSEHQNQIPLDAAHLQLLQQKTQSAQGQMEAFQYANQLAAYQANQLLQMRQMLIAQHNAFNTKNQAEVDLKAMQQAAREAATKRLSPEILPAGRNWSVRDAF